MARRTRALRDVLTEVLTRIGLDPAGPEARLRADWPSAAGPEVARWASVARLDRGRLTLTVKESAARTEVWMRREALKASLNAFLGAATIKDIRLD